MNAVLTLAAYELQRLDNDCHAALARIGRTRLMRDVACAARVNAVSWLRPMANALPTYRNLPRAAEARMEALLVEQLEELSHCATLEAARRLRAQRMQQDWCYLRGEFARLFQRAERESASHIARLA